MVLARMLLTYDTGFGITCPLGMGRVKSSGCCQKFWVNVVLVREFNFQAPDILILKSLAMPQRKIHSVLTREL
jgi:hypothetical protein